MSGPIVNATIYPNGSFRLASETTGVEMFFPNAGDEASILDAILQMREAIFVAEAVRQAAEAEPDAE